MTVTPKLSFRMRELAKTRDDLPPNWNELADNFEAATLGYYSIPPTVSAAEHASAWAKARWAYCKVTGKPLI